MYGKLLSGILISCCLFLGGWQKEITQNTIINTDSYVKRPFSELTRVQLEVDIYDIGPKKSKIIFDEQLKGGPFKSAQDFEDRLTGKLSPKMINRVLKHYSF